MQSNSSEKINFDNLKEMANSRLVHKVTKFNNPLIKTKT